MLGVLDAAGNRFGLVYSSSLTDLGGVIALKPGFMGYEPYCPWTKAPGKTWAGADLARAKQLVKESGTVGQKVTIVASDRAVEKALGIYLQSVLRELGYDAALKSISSNIQFTYIQNTKNQVQISVTTWYQDYPAPSNFLNVLFSCASFREGSDSSINIPGLCDKALDAEMAKAAATSLTDPAEAARRTVAMVLFVLLPLSSWSVYVFAAVMGFVWLGTVPLTTGVISQVFGVRYIATLFGFVFFGHQLGSFLGVWLGGYVYELTRSYDLIWRGAIGVGVLATILHWPIDDREIARQPRVEVRV